MSPHVSISGMSHPLRRFTSARSHRVNCGPFYLNASFTRSKAWCFRFFTLTQCPDLPPW
jgi:hypothetical protein